MTAIRVRLPAFFWRAPWNGQRKVSRGTEAG